MALKRLAASSSRLAHQAHLGAPAPSCAGGFWGPAGRPAGRQVARSLARLLACWPGGALACKWPGGRRNVRAQISLQQRVFLHCLSQRASGREEEEKKKPARGLIQMGAHQARRAPQMPAASHQRRPIVGPQQAVQSRAAKRAHFRFQLIVRSFVPLPARSLAPSFDWPLPVGLEQARERGAALRHFWALPKGFQ